MGDMGDLFNEMKNESKTRRESHRNNAPKILSDAGLNFIVYNAGAHLVLPYQGVVDFWPGSGKWILS